MESQLAQESEAISSWCISVGLRETKHLRHCSMLENSPGWPTPLGGEKPGLWGTTAVHVGGELLSFLDSLSLLLVRAQFPLLGNLFPSPCLASFTSYSNTTLEVGSPDTWARLPGFKIQLCHSYLWSLEQMSSSFSTSISLSVKWKYWYDLPHRTVMRVDTYKALGI